MQEEPETQEEPVVKDGVYAPEFDAELDRLAQEMARLAHREGVQLAGIMLLVRVEGGYLDKIACEGDAMAAMRQVMYMNSHDSARWDRAYE